MFCANCGATLTTHDASSGRCDQCGNVSTTSSNPYAPGAAVPSTSSYEPSASAAMGAGFSGEDPGPPISLDAIPKAPRTASPRARDLVFGYQGAQRVRLIIGVVFMAVGSITLFAFGGSPLSDLLLAMFGAPTQATMIESHLEMNVSINHAHPTLIRYAYEVHGDSFEGESSTLDRSIAKSPGAPIQIELLTSIPSISRASGTTCSPLGYAGLFVFIFPLVGASLTFSAVRSNRREIRAFVHGRPVIARVVSRGLDRRVRMNGRSPTKIVWEFDVNGRSHQGDISHMSAMALGDLMRGPSVVVLYDPRNPDINTVWVA